MKTDKCLASPQTCHVRSRGEINEIQKLMTTGATVILFLLLSAVNWPSDSWLLKETTKKKRRRSFISLCLTVVVATCVRLGEGAREIGVCVCVSSAGKRPEFRKQLYGVLCCTDKNLKCCTFF